MTTEEANALVQDIAVQVGIPIEKLLQSLKFWRPNLLAIPSEAALEGLKVLLINGGQAGKDPGKWIGAIVRYCGGANSQQQTIECDAAVLHGCQLCDLSGAIEVPSHKDWFDGIWLGNYTMTVACNGCQLGLKRACSMMTIRQYEGRFPNWRDEYPWRMHDRQLNEMIAKPAPRDRECEQKHKAKIAWLRQQLQGLPR